MAWLYPDWFNLKAITVKIGEDTVKVATHPTFEVTPDTAVWLRFPADEIRWVDWDSGRVLYPLTTGMAENTLCENLSF